MSQILHIFKKDTRRFWLEIVLSGVLMFAYVWVFPIKWKVYHDQMSFYRMMGMMTNLGMLVPVGWWLLAARVVHAESLVGDEQFWITRPYEWGKLLAAKVLFIAVWIGAPYLLAQSWLLTMAGFHPLSYIPGLLYCLLVVLVVFALPAMAVASVTSTFARLALTMVGGFFAYLAFSFWNNMPRDYTASQPYGNRVLPVALIAGCVAAIVLQYARRREWIARAILLAVPIVMLVSVGMYSRASLVDRAYPEDGGTAPMSISFAPTAARPVRTNRWDGAEHIYLPVHYAGIADGYAVFVDDVKFTMTAADGTQWSSPWQVDRQQILPDQGDSTLQLKLRPEVYERFKSGPVTLHVTFAVSRYQADSVTQIAYPAADAAIPGVGFCTPQLYGLPNLHCRAAIDGPRLTHVTAMWAKSGCADSSHLFEPTAKGSAWLGPMGFDTHLATVWTANLWMDYHQTDEEQKQHLPWQICPGSPLTLTTYHSVGVGRTELTLTNFVLPSDVRLE